MKRLKASIFAFLVAAVIPTAATRAGVLIDFNNQSDSALTRYNPLAGVANLPGGSYGFPQLGGPGSTNFGYELTSPAVPAALIPAVGQARVGSLYTGTMIADFSVSADLVKWNDNLGQAFGVVGRITNAGLGTSDGYGAFYITAAGNGGSTGALVIDRFTNEGATTIQQTDVTLDPTKSYRITFTGVGSNLTAQLVTLSTPSVTVASAATTDSVYSTGEAGLIASANLGTPTSAVDVTFDNLAISAVPEPSPFLLSATAAAAGLAVTGWRRARTSKAPAA